MEKDNIHISNWSVLYDTTGMPYKIIGELSSGYGGYDAGHTITIKDPIFLDLKNNIVRDNKERVFSLDGTGFHIGLLEN